MQISSNYLEVYEEEYILFENKHIVKVLRKKHIIKVEKFSFNSEIF